MRVHCNVFRIGLVTRRLDTLTSSSMAAPLSSSTARCSDVNVKTQTSSPDGNTAKRKMGSNQYKTHPRKMFKSNYEARFNETDYFFDEGFRRVKPYVYAFETFAKGRWYGRELLDVFKKEFRLETPEFYAKAIETGLIKINGERTTADYIIKNNDFLHSRVHRHEPPVTSDPIDIVAKTDEFVVVNKPASMPVHPCGKYRHNTIVFLLAKEHKLIQLHTIHRLDRLTSGLLIFARTKPASQRIDALVRERKLKKTYVCKVSGEFPSETVECNEPIFIVSHKIGVCRVRPDGKPCRTTFERISYDGETSIVKCFPETGRMHQIRVHLQYLGHPILNDPLYNNPVWGPARGQGGCQNLADDQLLERLVKQHDEQRVTKINEYLDERSSAISQTEKLPLNGKKAEIISDGSQNFKNGDLSEKELLNPEQILGGDLAIDGNKNCAGAEPTRGVLDEQSSSASIPLCEGTEPSACVDVGSINKQTGPTKVMETCDSSSKDSMKLEVSTSKGNLEPCESVIASNPWGIDRGDRVTHMDQSNPGGASYGPHSLVKTGKAGTVHKNGTMQSAISSSDGPEKTGFHSGNEAGIAAKDEAATIVASEIPPTPGNEGGDLAVSTEHGTTVTEMDGTLTGVGVLEVDEQRLQELADEGSEGSVDQIAQMLCRECVTPLPDPRPEEMMIYLHALSYKGPDFEFSTPLPKWAEDHIEASSHPSDITEEETN